MIKNLSDVNGSDYEYVVVGTGPAGLSLAINIATKSKKVLLLEGGGLTYTTDSQSMYDGKVIGKTDYDIKHSRLRFFGGTSNHWGGMCRPLDDIDLLNFPIDKSDLDHHLAGASEILGIDHTYYEHKLNDNFSQNEFKFSLVNFNHKYKDFIESSKDIDLVLNANVLSLMGDNTNSNLVRYINVAKNPGDVHKIYVNKLIIACGGIENSRLMLWSQYLNKKLLKNIVIGKRWMEHPHDDTAVLIGYKEKVDNLFKKRLVQTIYITEGITTLLANDCIYISPTEEFITKNKIGNAGIRLFLDSPEKSFPKLKKLIKDIVCIAPDFGKKLFSLADRNLICGLQVTMAWEQQPKNENCIELDFDNKDAFGSPRTKLVWDLDETDKKTPSVCMKSLGELLIERDIGRIGIIPKFANTEDQKVALGTGGDHHMGGTNMANDPSEGVVDSNLKVFGIDNLWITGSSTFASGGHANPTLTIVQLSLRLASHLNNL